MLVGESPFTGRIKWATENDSPRTTPCPVDNDCRQSAVVLSRLLSPPQRRPLDAIEISPSPNGLACMLCGEDSLHNCHWHRHLAPFPVRYFAIPIWMPTAGMSFHYCIRQLISDRHHSGESSQSSPNSISQCFLTVGVLGMHISTRREFRDIQMAIPTTLMQGCAFIFVSGMEVYWAANGQSPKIPCLVSNALLLWASLSSFHKMASCSINSACNTRE